MQVVPAWYQVLLQLSHWEALGGFSKEPSPSTQFHDWKMRLHSGSGAKLAALGDRHSVGEDRHVSQLNLRSLLLFVKYCLAELETLNWPKTILSPYPIVMGCLQNWWTPRLKTEFGDFHQHVKLPPSLLLCIDTL